MGILESWPRFKSTLHETNSRASHAARELLAFCDANHVPRDTNKMPDLLESLAHHGRSGSSSPSALLRVALKSRTEPMRIRKPNPIEQLLLHGRWFGRRQTILVKTPSSQWFPPTIWRLMSMVRTESVASLYNFEGNYVQSVDGILAVADNNTVFVCVGGTKSTASFL